jgi:RecA/RadA recombinase
MMQMMQMFQMFGGNAAGMPMMDPSAVPFAPAVSTEADPGLDAHILRPATFQDLIRHQRAIPTGTILDRLCLTEDGKAALGGLPMGNTIAFAGPPGAGKTRSALVALARVAAGGDKVGFVVAEEGFHEKTESGRDDLCSRLVKIGMEATGMDEAAFRAGPLDRLYVLEAQYHRNQTWDDFVQRYRYLIEKEGIRFVVVDSLNMLDPTRNRTADNLSALKTYNHEKGVTCICIGQIRDTGQPVGGEALMHTADAVFLIEQLTLTSKEMAAQWGGSYRDTISVLRAVKSVTTPVHPHPIRITQQAPTGALQMHPSQPADMVPPEPRA